MPFEPIDIGTFLVVLYQNTQCMWSFTTDLIILDGKQMKNVFCFFFFYFLLKFYVLSYSYSLNTTFSIFMALKKLDL